MVFLQFSSQHQLMYSIHNFSKCIFQIHSMFELQTSSQSKIEWCSSLNMVDLDHGKVNRSQIFLYMLCNSQYFLSILEVITIKLPANCSSITEGNLLEYAFQAYSELSASLHCLAISFLNEVVGVCSSWIVDRINLKNSWQSYCFLCCPNFEALIF